MIDTTGDARLSWRATARLPRHNVVQFLTCDRGQSEFDLLLPAGGAGKCPFGARDHLLGDVGADQSACTCRLPAATRTWEPEKLAEFCRHLRFGCHLFQGITDATMSHNEAWHFMRLGGSWSAPTRPRAFWTSSTSSCCPRLDDVGTPYDDIQWSAVLKSVSGLEMYRKRHGRISPRDIVDFLVLDRDFPRAIHFCIHGADDIPACHHRAPRWGPSATAPNN